MKIWLLTFCSKKKSKAHYRFNGSLPNVSRISLQEKFYSTKLCFETFSEEAWHKFGQKTTGEDLVEDRLLRQVRKYQCSTRNHKKERLNCIQITSSIICKLSPPTERGQFIRKRTVQHARRKNRNGVRGKVIFFVLSNICILRIDLILMTKTSDSSSRGRFDIYLDGNLHHDSIEHGIPGPSAIENLIEILRKRLSI